MPIKYLESQHLSSAGGPPRIHLPLQFPLASQEPRRRVLGGTSHHAGVSFLVPEERLSMSYQCLGATTKWRAPVYTHRNLNTLLKFRREKNHLFIAGFHPLGIRSMIHSAVGFKSPKRFGSYTRSVSGQECFVPSSSSQRRRWETDWTTSGTLSMPIMDSFQSWRLKKNPESTGRIKSDFNWIAAMY